jgi:hypothetical protein
MLSPTEIQSFRRDGYLLLDRPILSARSFEGLKARFEARLAQLPAGDRPEAMDVPHFDDTALFEWLFSPEILGIAESLLGPDLALFSSHFICKPAGDGRRVPWHEDSAYWRGQLDPMEVVTLWIAIDPSTRENGCLHVVPGSHRHGDSEYQPVPDPGDSTFGDEIREAREVEARAVPLELAPNEASVHDGRLVHGSPRNRSAHRRCGYTMRYISTRTRFDAARHPWHQIYLARGRDHAGNVYADPAVSYFDLLRERARVFKGH